MSYIGNIPAEKYQTLQKQSFTTSATDTYTLSYSVTNPQDLALFINNVRQNPNDAYTVSGTTLTLSSAITSSDTMYAVFLGRAVETIAPATGSVTNDMLAGSIATSKLADGSTFATTNGITMADQWRLTADTTGNGDVTANWERIDEASSNYIGTGLSESSGIFSFPSTGIYLIIYTAAFTKESSDAACNLSLYVTTDNSSYNEFSVLYTALSSNTLSVFGLTSTAIIDVTNTTTHKFKFTKGSFSGSTTLGGDTNQSQTHFTVIRLGDT